MVVGLAASTVAALWWAWPDMYEQTNPDEIESKPSVIAGLESSSHPTVDLA